MAGLDAYYNAQQQDWDSFYKGNAQQPRAIPTYPTDMTLADIFSAPRTDPLAPSQGGPWPTIPQRPRAVALTPQNYKPTVLPQDPNDPNRMPPGVLPFVDAPPRTASLPQGLTIKPFGNQYNLMDPGNEGYVDPNASPIMPSYLPETGPGPVPAVSAIEAATAGAAPAAPPQTSVLDDMVAGLASLFSGPTPKPLTPGQSYDAKNAAAADAARNQDRSGVGTDGYVRDVAGGVVGRDQKYAGLSPGAMYDAITGRAPDDSFKTIGPSGNKSVSADFWKSATPSASNRRPGGPVTAGPIQRPQTGGATTPITSLYERPKTRPTVQSQTGRTRVTA